MARKGSAGSHLMQYAAARLVAESVCCFDAPTNLRTAALIGRSWAGLDRWSQASGLPPARLLARVLRNRRARAMTHLAQAFPELSDAQRQRICDDSFEHFVQLAVEVLHSPRLLNARSWSAHVQLGPIHEALRLLGAPGPVILITGHVGNWEVMGLVLSLLGYDLHAVARPIDNPLINRWLLGIRQRRGLRVITKWDATERMVGVLAGGGALAFIADQNAGDRGLFVPFFGRLASSYKIGMLAMQHNAPIVCGYAHRLSPDFRFELGTTDVIYPGDWADQPDPLFYITARYQRAIELMIRRRPEQYFWMHRRWKSRPGFERRGRAMPPSLRAKLEALPWMDQPTMDRLCGPDPVNLGSNTPQSA